MPRSPIEKRGEDAADHLRRLLARMDDSQRISILDQSGNDWFGLGESQDGSRTILDYHSASAPDTLVVANDERFGFLWNESQAWAEQVLDWASAPRIALIFKAFAEVHALAVEGMQDRLRAELSTPDDPCPLLLEFLEANRQPPWVETLMLECEAWKRSAGFHREIVNHGLPSFFEPILIPLVQWNEAQWESFLETADVDFLLPVLIEAPSLPTNLRRSLVASAG